MPAPAASPPAKAPPPGPASGLSVAVPEPEAPAFTMEEALSDECMVVWACPTAPADPRKTRKLRQKQGLPPHEHTPINAQALDVIKRFAPSREWTDADGVQWVQHVCTEPASRLDSVLLAEKLDKKLYESGARPTGICPQRQKMYRECFDELVRQITAESAERGILLLKVRRERERMIDAYKQILESRAGYAFRIALKGDKDTYIMKTRIAELTNKKRQLIEEEEKLKQEEIKVRAQGEEQAKEDEKRRKEELGMLLKEAQLKKAQLEAITALPRK
eukprot:TRINITY_DN4272_c0_g3_i1.p2 TRINITY_DN4272_c0_g3~~TRINITY_DN4272_c0_g3_i1.p2  ORF type:complete len:276 (+),score=88.36 TRINITY_DN4272_c0_g3_i1:310-1137(+)